MADVPAASNEGAEVAHTTVFVRLRRVGDLRQPGNAGRVRHNSTFPSKNETFDARSSHIAIWQFLDTMIRFLQLARIALLNCCQIIHLL